MGLEPVGVGNFFSESHTMTDKQPEALRLAAWLNEGAWHKMTLGDVERAGRELRRLSQHEAALEEWLKKTEWVQKTQQPGEAGKHRADVLRDRIAALEAENVELRKDAARMDYLQEHGSTVELVNISDECWDFRVGGLHVAVSPSIRAAIDAALKETP